MIIRIKKLHILAAVFGLLCVSFLLALKAEKPFRQVLAAEDERLLPIVMYHHVTEKAKRAGKYVIKADELRHDLEYIEKKATQRSACRILLTLLTEKSSCLKKLS